MRVLFITGEFPPMQGGVGDYTDAIARGLTAYQVEAQVLTSLGAMDHSLPALDRPAVSISPVIRRWDWSSWRAVRRAILDFAPQIVNIQYQTGAYAMHPAINFLPRELRRSLLGRADAAFRTVVTFHDLRIPYLFPKAGPVRHWVTRELACSSDAVIATNRQDYAQLARWKVKPLELIPIGSNIPTTLPTGYARATWRAQLGVAQDELLLCHFGFVNAQKGCDTLIRALAGIPNAKLLMIGGQTGSSDPTNVAYHAQIRALIEESGVRDRVLWTGYTTPERVTANFTACDLCVLPYRGGASYQHGTLMAALAHALPIITTRHFRQMEEGARGAATLPELCDGENCLLVPPDDVKALVRAVQRVADSPDLRARICLGAAALAENFTWDKIVLRHLQLFNRLLV